MSETAVAAKFKYRHEAEFARETLRDAGIESVLVEDDVGGAYPGLLMSGGHRVVVRVEDLDRARSILAGEGTLGDDDPDLAS